VTSWQGRGVKGQLPHPPILAFQEIFLLWEKSSTSKKNLQLKIPRLTEFRGKIEILSTRISSVGNLQPSVNKLQLLDPEPF